MTQHTPNPATAPEHFSPKQWKKIQEKHGKTKPHFQTGSPKAGTAHSPNSKKKGAKHTTPKFENIHDTSHQIQQLPTNQTAAEKAAHDAAKVNERQECAEKAGFTKKQAKTYDTKNITQGTQFCNKNGEMGRLGKLKNPSVCKAPQVPTGRHH